MTSHPEKNEERNKIKQQQKREVSQPHNHIHEHTVQCGRFCHGSHIGFGIGNVCLDCVTALCTSLTFSFCKRPQSL